MRLSSAFRASVIALAVLAAATVSAYADSGTIYFKVVKAGFIIGGSGGTGTLTFHTDTAIRCPSAASVRVWCSGQPRPRFQEPSAISTPPEMLRAFMRPPVRVPQLAPAKA
jgi:hypothetical protein